MILPVSILHVFPSHPLNIYFLWAIAKRLSCWWTHKNYTNISVYSCNYMYMQFYFKYIPVISCSKVSFELPCIQFKVLNIMNKFSTRHQMKRSSIVLLISVLAGHHKFHHLIILGVKSNKYWDIWTVLQSVTFLLSASKQQAEEVTLLAACFTYTSTLKKAQCVPLKHW